MTGRYNKPLPPPKPEDYTHILAVPCPRCDAGPGVPCVRPPMAYGVPGYIPHTERFRAHGGGAETTRPQGHNQSWHESAEEWR